MPRTAKKLAGGKSGGSSNAASAFVTSFNKKHGASAAKRLDEDIISATTEFISTQHPLIDMTIGHPGIPVGRMVTIFGESSTGKTHLVYHILQETQRRGGLPVLIDAEYALDPIRAAAIGLDPERLIVLQPHSLEDAFQFILDAIEMLRHDYPEELVAIALDSVAGLNTRAQLEGKLMPGEAAKIASHYLRMINDRVASNNVAVILVNQYRENIMAAPYGNKKTMLAARACKFYASVTMETSSLTQEKGKVDGEEVPIALKARLKNQKNKVGAPFRMADFKINYVGDHEGIDVVDGIFALALKKNFITQSGAWYQVGDGRKFYRAGFANELIEHPEWVPEILALTGFEYPADSRLMNIVSELRPDEAIAIETEEEEELDEFDDID